MLRFINGNIFLTFGLFSWTDENFVYCNIIPLVLLKLFCSLFDNNFANHPNALVSIHRRPHYYDAQRQGRRSEALRFLSKNHYV